METSTAHRPWETTSPPQTQKLPSISTLTRDVDLRAGEKSQTITPRDSAGSWTGTTGIPQVSSTSTTSNNTMPYLTSSSNHSPSQQAQPYTPTEPTMPSSAFSSARSSGVPNHGIDTSEHRGSGNFDDSRRGSVDSRIHQGIDSLRIGGPTSPYNQSANASQTSLASSLQQQRGILTNGARLSGGSGPMSPAWARNAPRALGGAVASRIAPPIAEHPARADMFAAEPVRGQAWAFPDPDAGSTRPDSTVSRRNSQASSFTNTSLYSELRAPLPPGQHELPDHHHHTAMPTHDRIQSLKGDPDSPNGSTAPYSRTPELRVTHKLAERKRRSEMKDCFEQLRQKLPVNSNNKSSKWETLARAIEYIQALENSNRDNRHELNKTRQQMEQMELQIKELSARVGNSNYQPPPPSSMPFPNGTASYTNGVESEGPRTLPPIMNGNAMQGVQYGENGR